MGRLFRHETTTSRHLEHSAARVINNHQQLDMIHALTSRHDLHIQRSEKATEGRQSSVKELPQGAAAAPVGDARFLCADATAISSD